MKTIGKYEITGLLGRGGMGAVYKVRMPVTGRIAALKLLSPDETVEALWGRETLERLFRTEAATLGGLRHPNIVKVWDYDEDNGRPFFIMDYYCDNLGQVIGETYRVETPSRILPVSRAVSYARQILDGAARLHHAGIVHRDLKPFNILLTGQDAVKITDFGLSKVRGERYRGPANLKVGSPYYASPEQERDPDSAGPAADLYAAGIMLYRMLTGLLPEDGMARAVPASKANPDLDGDWDAFLGKAAHARSESRFASAVEMREALDALYHAFRRRIEESCAIDEAALSAGEQAPDPCLPKVRPRRTPAKISSDAAREAFGLDELWRPREYVCGDLAEHGGGVLADAATGLTWQRHGAEFPLEWTEAAEYVAALNAQGYGGFSDWRLPTAPELATIMRPVPAGEGYCLDPLLRPAARRVWSADRRTFVSAWLADMELGYLGWGDFTCLAGVLAVRGG